MSRPTAYEDGTLWGFIRHARISQQRAAGFWERMAEFDRLPRTGDAMYGFAVGVYPTDHPTLPDGSTGGARSSGSSAASSRRSSPRA